VLHEQSSGAAVAPAPFCEALAAALGQPPLQQATTARSGEWEVAAGALASELGAELAGGVVVAARLRRQLANVATWLVGEGGAGERQQQVRFAHSGCSVELLLPRAPQQRM
jgi:hypothetical protein